MKRLFLAFFTLLMANADAQLLFPPGGTDDEMVARSDAIVEGHVEAGFAADGAEFRTVLIVVKSIEGRLSIGPMPLIIHQGLLPVVLDAKTPAGRQMGDFLKIADQNTGRQVPVGLFLPSSTIGEPPTADIRKDQIWFLRRASTYRWAKEDTSAPGVRWQEDVEPLEREGYYRAVLSGDPAALAPFTKGDSWEAQQARLVQDRLRVQRLDKISDPGLRADALAAFMAAKPPFSLPAQLALEKLTALGPTGLLKLVPIFQNADRAYDRQAILTAWRDGHYQPAKQVIRDWLRSENAWWAKQTPQDMIWSFQVGAKGGPEYDDPRTVSSRNVGGAVWALCLLGDKEAKPTIQQTRDQWAALRVHPDPGNDMVSACDQALAQLH
jgi:hypothetical protein